MSRVLVAQMGWLGPSFSAPSPHFGASWTIDYGSEGLSGKATLSIQRVAS